MTTPSITAVRESVATAQTHLERAAEQVVWQIEHQVWTVLGYASWDEMRRAEYGGAAVIVPRADRPELVSRLRSEGLSQQQIGNTIGVTDTTVRRDLGNQQMSDTEGPATRSDSLGRERPTSYQRRDPDPEPEPEPVDVDDIERAEQAVTEGLRSRVPDSENRLARTRTRARWSRAIAGAADIPLMKPTDVADALTDSELAAARFTLTNLSKWFARLDTAGRSDLRLISGDDT